jgi:hypothetical protein
LGLGLWLWEDGCFCCLYFAIMSIISSL